MQLFLLNNNNNHLVFNRNGSPADLPLTAWPRDCWQTELYIDSKAWKGSSADTDGFIILTPLHYAINRQKTVYCQLKQLQQKK